MATEGTGKRVLSRKCLEKLLFDAKTPQQIFLAGKNRPPSHRSAPPSQLAPAAPLSLSLSLSLERFLLGERFFHALPFQVHAPCAASLAASLVRHHGRRSQHFLGILVAPACRYRNAGLVFLGDASLFERRVLLIILIAMKALSLGRRHGRVQCGHKQFKAVISNCLTQTVTYLALNCRLQPSVASGHNMCLLETETLV